MNQINGCLLAEFSVGGIDWYVPYSVNATKNATYVLMYNPALFKYNKTTLDSETYIDLNFNR